MASSLPLVARLTTSSEVAASRPAAQLASANAKIGAQIK
jgi:hypothetical protein